MLKGGFLPILREVIAIKRQRKIMEVAFDKIFFRFCKVNNYR